MSLANGLTFFTSDSRPKYANDVLNILALPSGSKYQFRYESKYISSDIKNVFDNQAPIGTRCLIAFRHESSENIGEAFIVPIRWATLDSIELISDFYIIKFCLNSYPTPSSAYGSDKIQIARSSILYLDSCNASTRKLPVHLGLTSLVDPKERDNRDIWLTIAKALALHTTFLETHFLRIAGVVDNNAQLLKISNDKKYIVAEQQYVSVQVDYFALNYSKNNGKLTVDSDVNVIRIAAGATIFLDSRYDSHRIQLQARSVVGPTMAEVVIGTEDERVGAAQTKIILPFEVLRSYRTLALRITINAVGAILVAVPGIMGPNTEIGSRILVACIGALLLAVGTNLIPQNK